MAMFQIVGNFKDNINAGLKQLNTNTKNIDKTLNGTIKTVKNLAGAFGIAFGAQAIIKGIKSLTSDVIALGDEIDKASQRVGLSIEDYQKWNYVMELNGTSMNEVSTGLQRFQKNIVMAADGTGKAAVAFDALNIEAKNIDGSFRKADDLFKETVLKLSKMEDITLRNAYAQQIFGEAGARIVPLLNAGTKAIEEQYGELEKLGALIGEESVQASAKFNDTMMKLNKTIDGMKFKILLPIIQDLEASLSRMLADGSLQKRFQDISNSLLSFYETSKKVGKFIKENFVGIACAALIAAAPLIAAAVGAMTTSVIAFTAAMATNPFVLAGVAVAALLPQIQKAIDKHKEWLKTKNMEEPIEEGEDPRIAGLIEQNNQFNNQITKLQDNLKSLENVWNRFGHMERTFGAKKFEDTPNYKDNIKNIELYEGWVTKNEEKMAEIRKQNAEKAVIEKGLAEKAAQDQADAEKLAAAKETQEKIAAINKATADISAENFKEMFERVKKIEEANLAYQLKILENTKQHLDAKAELEFEYHAMIVKDFDAIAYEYAMRLDEMYAYDVITYDKRNELLRQFVDEQKRIKGEEGTDEANKRMDDIFTQTEGNDESPWTSVTDIGLEYEAKEAAIIEAYDREAELYEGQTERIAEIQRRKGADLGALQKEKSNEYFQGVKQNFTQFKSMVENIMQATTTIQKAQLDKRLEGFDAEIAAINTSTDAGKNRVKQITKDKQKAIESFKDEYRQKKRIYLALAVIEGIGSVVTAIKAGWDQGVGLYSKIALAAFGGAIATAQTATNIATIASQNFKTGGFPEGKDAIVRVNEDGQESILNARATSSLGKQNIDALNNGNGNIGGTNVTVSPSIVIQGNADSNTVDQMAEQLDVFARKVERAFTSRFIDTSRIKLAMGI